jgi:hypothetical protein
LFRLPEKFAEGEDVAVILEAPDGRIVAAILDQRFKSTSTRNSFHPKEGRKSRGTM